MVDSTRRFILSLALCFVLVFFSPFSIAITTLGKERAGLCILRAFVCFARVGLCLFSLPLGVGEWLQLVIVALIGLFILPLLQKWLPSDKMLIDEECIQLFKTKLLTRIFLRAICFKISNLKSPVISRSCELPQAKSAFMRALNVNDSRNPVHSPGFITTKSYYSVQ